MSMTSIMTNHAAMAALQSLNRTNDALAQVQKRISTGYRVADAKDDGGPSLSRKRCARIPQRSTLSMNNWGVRGG
jgi:hypothetical protein